MQAALLLIDVQGEYFPPGGRWVVPDGPRILARIQALLAAARTARLPVFHVVHESLDSAASVFRRGTPEVEIHPEIHPLPGEEVIRKHFPGSFTQTPLEAHLRRAGADTLIVCGFLTHVCCDTTTRQARERDFAVWFAADATGTRTLPLGDRTIGHDTVQEAVLAVMGHFAAVLPAAEIARRLGENGCRDA